MTEHIDPGRIFCQRLKEGGGCQSHMGPRGWLVREHVQHKKNKWLKSILGTGREIGARKEPENQ